ncbi:serine/arginine repetitive matrix protein 3-like [Dorcoceras hygrometricum]|nr:serine/arginine repetitive matrix protein 3-like [Dorcoceras hygrometricum]
MGSCLSKKSVCVSSSSSSSVVHSNQPERLKSNTQLEKNKAEEEETVKKEIFIIKHRKSQDRTLQSDVERKRDVDKGEESGEKCRSVSGDSGAGNGVEIVAGGGGGGVRTSSCTKEELDAILIQCGRLSRSSSTGKAASLSENCGKRYSGSKRSFDFDAEGNSAAVDGDERDGVAGPGSESRRHRHRSRQSTGRRRTPSRERERRVSRSPGRRSASPAPRDGTNSCPATSGSKPAKMVSVPATDKSSNGCSEPDSNMAVKRIQVKRNAGGDGAVASRTASPRTQSPARIKTSNENQSGQVQQPLPLSRSNSRKADISPYRRNPLGEIDTNIMLQTPLWKQNTETNQIVQGEAENKLRCSNSTNPNCKTKIETQVNVVTSASEGLQPVHSVIRSRSSRLSRELDINPETLSNPVVSSYTSLLLEDIQNFHQKNASPVGFTLPPCVTKACSILEAVADLNSTTSSNVSNSDRQRNPVTEQLSKSNETNKPISRGDPLMESEVVVSNNDLMDPTFHKYVTVGRGAVDVDEFEEQESSGSNSFTGGQQDWISPSVWKPNSVGSTDRWGASSRSGKRQHEVRHAVSDSGRGFNDSGKGTSSKKRELDQNQRSGIGRGRIGSRGAQKAAAAAT